MNKFTTSLMLCTSLFASTHIYMYSPVIDYREYKNGAVLDKDSSDFGDMAGVGIYYISRTRPLKFTLRFEFAAGESVYEGSTWDGKPLKTTQNGVHLFNFESALGMNYFFLTFGYREWKRGKSNYIGDYDEKYYWTYLGIRYDYIFYFKNAAFTPQISYQTAISPKMKVYLGNKPELKLGDTEGAYINLPLYFKYKEFVWFVFYKYQYWHISKSDFAILQTNNSRTMIYEPESITKNHFFGLGIVVNF